MNNKAKYSINSDETVEPRNKDEPKRDQWGSNIEFVLSCIGWSVGFGNVWRFPYLAYANGGGAFLFPYVVLLLLVGKPMYFLEVAIGQFCSLGPLGLWNCFPLAKGVGVAMVVVSFVVSINYTVLLAYTLHFLRYSLEPILPWSGCYEWWGADLETCYVRSNQTICGEGDLSTTTVQFGNYSSEWRNCTNATQTAAEQYWEQSVLNLSSGIEEMGIIKWDLALCLAISWGILFLCLVKGVKTSGKVVYFAATFPYVCLLSLFIYGLTLDGASIGLHYLFVPQWDKVLEIKVWMAAASQLFYSLGLSWGGLIIYGSYNRFNTKVHRHAFFVSSLDFITSLIAGVVIFSVLGQLSKETGLKIQDVVQESQGLAFVAYPEALTRLWVPQLWSTLFFTMFFLLGIDSEFAFMETITSTLYDGIPMTRKYKPVICLCLCVTGCLLGLPCVMQGGPYVFQIMDYYGGSFVLLFIAVFEITAIMWGYGFRRICSDLEMMLGFKMNYYFQASWLVITPLLLSFIFIYGMLNNEVITYEGKAYPSWAIGLGWFLALLSMGQIPLWAIFMLIKHRKNLRYVIFPSPLWGPADPAERKKWEQMHNLRKQGKGLNINGIENPVMKKSESEV